MPTINKRFLLILLAIFAASAGIIFGIHSIQERRIPAALRGLVDRATAEGNKDVAIRYLRQYLEFRPKDLDAKMELAQKLSARGSTGELSYLYDSILRADPKRLDVRREAVAIALKMGRYTDAAEHADKVIEACPDDGLAWIQKADALAALHRTEEATKAYKSACQFAKDDPRAYRDYLFWIWTEGSKPAEAYAVAERFIAAFPKLPEPLVSRARMRMSENEQPNPEIKADLDRALKIDPFYADATVYLCDWLQRAGETSLARERLVEATVQHPADVRFFRRLAWLDLHRNNPITAVATLESGLKTVTKGYDELLVPLGDLLVQLGETKRANQIVEKLQAKTGRTDQIQAKYLTARLAMKAQDWTKAIEILTELRTDTVALPGLVTQTNLLLAICHRQCGNPVGERECLMLVLNRDPKHVSARVALGQSYLSDGDIGNAIREYEEAATSPYSSGQTSAMAIKLRALRLRMLGVARPQDWGELDRLAAATEAKFGTGSPEPTMLRADLLGLRGEPAHATALLRQILPRFSGDVRLWTSIAEWTGASMGIAAGISVCDEATATIGDRPEIRIARAELFARDPLKSYPFEILDRQIDGWIEVDQLQLFGGLIAAADRAGDQATVVRLSRRLAARQAGEPSAWVALFDRAFRANDAKTATFARDQLVRREGDSGPNVLICNAQNAISTMTAETAKTWIEKLSKVFGANPNRADVCVLLSQCLMKSGQGPAASQMIERAMVIDPIHNEAVRMALVIDVERNDANALRKHLGRLSIDPRWNGEPLHQVIMAALRSQPKPDSILLNEAFAIAKTEANPVAWFSNCLTMCGLAEQNRQWLSKACESPSATPDDFLRFAIAGAGQIDHVTAVMERAKKAMTPQAYLSISAALTASKFAAGWKPTLKNADETFAFVRSRVQYETARNHSHNAIDALAAFEKEPTISANDKLWATRTRALILASRGTPEDRRTAASLLLALPTSTGTNEEKRSSAATLVSLNRYLEGDDRTRVLTQAANLLADSKTGRDPYLLFQIYRAMGDSASREKARTILNELLKQSPNNLDYLVAGLDELVEAKAFTNAGVFADLLRKHHPADYRSVSSLARYECETGHADRALATIEAYVRVGDKNPTDRVNRSARAADLLDELLRKPNVAASPSARSLVNAAVGMYESLLPGRTEAMAAAAGLLASSKRTNDAYAFVNRHAGNLSALAKANAGVAILRSGETSEMAVKTARVWLDAAIADDPDATNVKLTEGEFFVLTGDASAAERAFQFVLDRDPQHSVALNNLAWILSPRPDQSAKALALLDEAAKESGYTPELLDTRARIRIATKQTDLAEKDLLAALTQEKTPLRYFHLAMAKQTASPPQLEEARKAFQIAIDKGLIPSMVHTADLTSYRSMLSGATIKQASFSN